MMELEDTRHERSYEYRLGRNRNQSGCNRPVCGQRCCGVLRHCRNGSGKHEDGLVKLLKKESLTHGINVSISENKISLDFHVIVSYGVSISAVTDNLINNVKYKVEEFTGMEIEKINILVEGVRVID